MDCCFQGNWVKLLCGHELSIVGNACQGCNTMSVYDGYVGKVLVTVLRDTGWSDVVVKRELVQDNQLTDEYQRCVLIDGTVRKFPVTEICIDTPFLSGPIKALCMNKQVYDLIIENVIGARNPEDQQVKWKSK